MRIYFFTLLMFTVLCSKVYADEMVDSNTDIVEKQNKDTVQKFSEVIKKWDANKSSMSVADFLSQKPEKIIKPAFLVCLKAQPKSSILDHILA